jgi:hypothetical protein
MSHEPREPLAQIAVADAGADGYAVYQVDPRTELRELKFAGGVPVPEPGDTGFTVDSFPLQVGGAYSGILTFVFRGSTISPATRAALERIAAAIEGVWRLALMPGVYARNAARIAEMETELADSKIADRARGMLAGGAPPRDAIDTIVRHVESVLRPGQLGIKLEQLRDVRGPSSPPPAPSEPKVAQTLARGSQGSSEVGHAAPCLLIAARRRAQARRRVGTDNVPSAA